MQRAARGLRVLLLLGLLGSAPAPRDVRALGGGGERGAPESESESEHREYQIKAAFLLNFIRYTTWPAECFPDAKAPIVLTVVGKDPFGSVLEETFKGERVNGREIVVARTRELPDPPTGHVVYCSDLSKPARTELIRACRRRPILLVGETPAFAEDGAGINFYIEDKKTRFEINTDAVAEAALVLSPVVLRVAKIVKTRTEEQR